MEMLTFCVETTYIGMRSVIYRQEEGLAMGSPLSPVLEYFEYGIRIYITKAIYVA